MSDKPIILDAADVAALLPQVDVLAEMRALFAELGADLAVQPPQTLTLLPDDRGDFITYLGAQSGADVFGAKLSPYLPTDGKPIITAWTMLMSMTSGLPLMLCDSGALTCERTAATTALAVDFLAKSDAARVAIIGAGAAAQAHWSYVSALRNWNEVQVFSPSLAGSSEKQAAWRAACPDVVFAASADEAAQAADVIMLCTSSGTPVIDPDRIAGGTLVTSISTNVAQAHEVAPAFLNHAQVYCDYRKTTPSTAGEMVLAAQNESWSPEAVQGDLGELSAATCPRPTSDQPVFFRSVGLGLEDIAVANAIYRAARQ